MNWELVTGSREGWERFCALVGMQTHLRAVQLVEGGSNLAAAVNAALEETAAGMERDGAPEGLITTYRKQYRTARAEHMHGVAEAVELRAGMR